MEWATSLVGDATWGAGTTVETQRAGAPAPLQSREGVPSRHRTERREPSDDDGWSGPFTTRRGRARQPRPGSGSGTPSSGPDDDGSGTNPSRS
ncbi:hypothetical protein GCM10025868_17750 [Angustibacter aerolatus]|uniref:Uncharacterized protein n=1 Tax=Angustibacter aerolatus TaxID=1162965 RepID=A0ABQ6JH15_9ACTN|nr:hypothetical protein GCM10025868_17750 [Angustibacter aerolatus]